MPRKPKNNESKLADEFSSRQIKGRKIKTYYDKAYARHKVRIDDLTENMAFYEGNQYSLPNYQSNKPWVIQMNTPYATLAIDTRVASLQASSYMGELEPFSPDDEETVSSLKAVYEDLWEELNMDQKINTAIAKGAVVREAYIHIIANTDSVSKGTNRRNKGTIEAYAIDPTHVWLDPKARKFSECSFICITERANYEKTVAKYPYLKDNLKVGQMSPYERGEVYIGNDYTTGQEDALTKITVYVKEYDKKDKMTIKKYTLIEDVLVDEEALTSLKHFPIAQFKWKSANDSPYGLSLMDELLSLQKAVNAIESAITNTALAYASPSMIVSKSCGVDPRVVALTTGSPGTVYAVDGDPTRAIVPVTTPQINDRIVNIKGEYENAISSIAGITSAYVGSIGTAGNTASGAEMSIERAKIIENIVIKNIEDFVEQLTFILIDYIIALYAGQNNIYTRTRNEMGKLMFNTRSLDKKASNVEYSFFVDLSARTRFSKDKEKQTLKDLYQMERQYDADIKLINEIDILEETDLRNKDIIRQRYNRMNAQSNEQKIQLINSLSEMGTKFNIDPSLLQQAQIEVMSDDEKMEAFKAVIQMSKQTASQMEQAMEQANQQAVQLGLPPEAVQQASQQLQDQGVNASMLNLG